MKYFLLRLVIFSLFLNTTISFAQQQSFDLSTLLTKNKLVNSDKNIRQLDHAGKVGVTCNGITWLKDVSFTEGTIEVDLRGKDLFQNSFLGIAFHGVDTITYDAVYFRPFNFHSPEELRRSHSVQYISEPLHSWDILRDQFPLVYENYVNPAPQATDWFHARIVVKENQVTVYVNQSEKPSLKVTKLNTRQTGLIGLWSSGSESDFANLVIKMLE